jgi:mRNA guanylyltransferase
MSGPVRSIQAPGLKIEGELLYNMRQEVANLLDRGRNLNFPGAQPVSFARRHLEELTQRDYYVCEKSDGMRYLLYSTRDDEGGELHYLIDRKNDYWFIPPNTIHFPIPNDETGFHTDTLIDGELVFDTLPNGGKQPKYLVFDCMVLDGNSLMNRTLDKRIAYFKERVFDPYKLLLKKYPQELPFQHFIVELKQMQFSYAVEKMFKQILPALPHGNDGLIFTCRTTDYKSGTDQHILKWKPEDENSIDFRLCLDFPLVQPDEVDRAEGITEPYVDYGAMPTFNLHVYAGDAQEDPWYSTMYVEPGEWEAMKALQEPFNDRIVECYMDRQKRWRYKRPRDDKSTANHTSTVESVIESIKDCVTEEDLIAEAMGIRAAWKEREKRPVDPKRMASVSTNGPVNGGMKRKAEEQGGGRPSPSPPVKQE